MPDAVHPRQARPDHFGVTRYLDLPGGPGAIGHGDATQFDVVFRRNHDFRMGVKVLWRQRNSARPSEKIASKFPDRFRVAICGAPKLPAGHVAEVTEGAPIVACTVFAPAVRAMFCHRL